MADSGQTPAYKLRYPEPTAADDVPKWMKYLAEDVEAALGAVAGGAGMAILRVAGVVTQITETRPDGSKRLMILRYANDRLVSVTRYNPSAVDTLTYNGAGQFTGYTTA